MAWYEITYACGHTGREQLYGKEADRKSLIEWKSTHQICPECFAKEIENQNRKAIASNTNGVLPQLTGSEKQIAWAISIREKALATLDSTISEVERNITAKINNGTIDQATAEALRSKNQNDAEMCRKIYLGVTDSKIWIDNRNCTESIIANALKNGYKC